MQPHLKNQNTLNRSLPLPRGSRSITQPSLIALRAEKTVGFSVPSSFVVSLPAVDWAVRVPTYPGPPSQLLWIYLSLRNQIITSNSHHSLGTMCASDFQLRAFFPCTISLNPLEHPGSRNSFPHFSDEQTKLGV